MKENAGNSGAENFYCKLAKGENLSILIVGDSIGCGAGASTGDRTWASMLQGYLEAQYKAKIKLTNVSLGGNTSYAGYVSVMALDDDTAYDLAVVCYGQNDAPERFALFYETILYALLQRYPGCSVISILESSQQTYTEKIEEIRKICADWKIPCADMIRAFQESSMSMSELTTDDVHPNDIGQQIYYETLKAMIDGFVRQDGGQTGIMHAGSRCMDQFRHFVKYEVNEEKGFTRKDPVTFLLRTSERGLLGIDYTYVPGENRADVYVDGMLWQTLEVSFNYNFSQRHIQTVRYDECRVEREIKIVFLNKEQAEGFGGVFFSRKQSGSDGRGEAVLS